MSVSRGFLVAVVTVGLSVGLVVLSGVRYTPSTPAESLLRLSWRTRGQRVEACRRPTADEQASLPAHMRRDEICEGRIVPYRLHLVLDGEAAVAEEIHASGAREDRPVYVFREIWLAPGRHRIDIRFMPLDAGEDTDVLALDTTVTFAAGAIRLVTRSDDGNLEIR